jgi:hypothetical protein
MTDQERLAALYDYAAGHAGTRATIDKLGMRDFADLIIELARHDLALPRPEETPALKAHKDKARAILQPRLRHGT